jgi:Tfp pilus assembly protein PilV
MNTVEKTKSSKSRHAMTLIEALVATVLLGVGVAELVSAAALAMRNQQRSELRTAAIYLAQEKMAEIEMAGPHLWLLDHPGEGTEMRGGTTYTWKIAIEQKTVGELFDVKVEISWLSSLGQTANAELETWMNDYEATMSSELAPLGQEQQSGANRPQGNSP